jgi:zinc ribbon protein
VQAVSCRNCGARVPQRARFCPECGIRISADADATAVEEVPPDETGRVPVHTAAATRRYFGVTPPLAVLALAVVSLVLAIVVFVGGHVLAGALLLVGTLLFALVFAASARRLPDTVLGRIWARSVSTIRDRAGFAVEAVSVQSTARVELFRLRRELSELVAQRVETARALGEAVYGGADEDAQEARKRMRELDEALAAKEGEMNAVAAEANERIQRAQLQVQPTNVVEPPQVPEPMPVPSEPPGPVTVPEPTPVPSEPPMPVPAPDPTPEPSPPQPEPPPQATR